MRWDEGWGRGFFFLWGASWNCDAEWYACGGCGSLTEYYSELSRPSGLSLFSVILLWMLVYMYQYGFNKNCQGVKVFSRRIGGTDGRSPCLPVFFFFFFFFPPFQQVIFLCLSVKICLSAALRPQQSKQTDADGVYSVKYLVSIWSKQQVLYAHTWSGFIMSSSSILRV